MTTSIRARARCFAAFAVLAYATAFASSASAQATLSVGDMSIAEGNSGTKVATFAVTLSQAQSSPVFFDAATANGTATAGSDFVAKSLAGVRIPVGATSKAFTVTINGDTTAEPDESFTVVLSNGVGATIGDGQGLGTITNDDGGGSTASLSIGDAGVEEFDSGTMQLNFTMILSGSSENPITFDVSTSDGTATAGSDYVAKTQHFEIPPGHSGGFSFVVDAIGDLQFEADETFNVTISNLTGGAALADGLGVGTIVNDDPDLGDAPSLSIADVTVTEGNAGYKSAVFTLTLSKPLTANMNFGLNVDGVTAIAGDDFAQTGLNGWMGPGETTRTFEVMVKGDTTYESDETFTVTAVNVDGANVADGQAVGTILNDDPFPPSMSIGDATPVVEGNSGTKTMSFPVSLSMPAPAPVCFLLSVTGGTATVHTDFEETTVQPCIATGQSSYTYNIPVIGDTKAEPDETIEVAFSNVSGATLADGSAVGTITNDDTAAGPAISVADAIVVEGNSGDRNLDFVISIPTASAQNIGFTLTASALSASSPSDYTGTSFPGLSIPAGQTSTHVLIPVHGDSSVEAHETFKVTLSAISNADPERTVGYGRIVNDDDILFVSVPNDASQAASFAESKNAHMSPDGRFIAFESNADDMADACVDGECWSNFHREVYLRDLQTGRNKRVSAKADGSHPNNDSYKPVVSADGRYVAFESYATDLVAGAGQVYRQNVYVRDMQTGVVSRASVGHDGSLANANSGDPDISADGRYVAFTSEASNLVPGTAPSAYRVYVRDLQAGTTQLIADGNSSPGFRPAISSDGRYVAFESWLRLTPNDNDAKGDIFVADRTTGTIVLASTSEWGISPDGTARSPSISADGRRVAFLASSSVDSNFYVRDLDAGTTTKVLRGMDAVSAPNSNFNYDPRISRDGKRVAFTSQSSNLTSEGVVQGGEVFVRDIATGTTRKVTREIASRGRNLGPLRPMLSSDASLVVFDSDNNNMVVDDVDYRYNVFRAPVPAPPASVPSLSIADASVSEGNGGTKQLSFTVSLSAASSAPVGFEVFAFDGSAEEGNEYLAPAAQVYAIPAGQTSRTVAVTILGDTAVESDESFLLKLAHVSGATIGDGTATGTVTNDDAGGGGITLSVSDVVVNESNSSVQATFIVSLSATSTSNVYFDIATRDGSAVSFWPQDFAGTTQTGYFVQAGQLSRTVNVTVWPDDEVEPTECFDLVVRNINGATHADAVGRATIIDNDGGAGLPMLSIADVVISEGNSGTKQATFTVSLSAAATSPVGFDIATSNGTALAGSDYVASALAGQSIAIGQSSKTFSVTVNGDTAVESDEWFGVTLSNPTGATITRPTASGSILNDDSGGGGGPTLSINDVSIAEGNSGTKVATFTVTLSAAQSGPVYFDAATSNGTATAGSDYVAKTLTGQRIAAGATSKTFTVTINGDTTSETDETFTVNLSNPQSATIADGQGVGTISNDDAAATPTLSIADASVSEGNSGTKTLTFTVSLSPAAAGTVSYDIATSNGTATSGSDYVASSLTGQTISAGGTSKTFVVTINGDTTNESDETFNVTLTNVSGATLGDGAAVGTISNDDSGSGGLTLSIGDVSLSEGNSLTKQMTFTISLSAPAPAKVTFNAATADGTALAGSDYTAKSTTGLAILAGASSKTFVVVIKGDTVAEPNETFLVNISGVTGGATIADGQAVGTITNDDAALLRIARVDTQGLVDEIDDRNGQPVLTTGEYALLLADAATKLCGRAATIVAVDGVEHRAVLGDVADAANATCAKTSYRAVMADDAATGFLVEAKASVEVLGKPMADALQVQGLGHAGPITLLTPKALSSNATERSAQLRALGQSVQAMLKADPHARIVLIGGVTVPGLVDVTARSLPAKSKLPAERVLVSPALLEEFGKTKVEFPVLPANEAPAQVLQLQRLIGKRE